MHAHICIISVVNLREKYIHTYEYGNVNNNVQLGDGDDLLYLLVNNEPILDLFRSLFVRQAYGLGIFYIAC